MHEWIRNNTAVDAKFIIPPNDESFLCEAQRSALVSYKPMIHQEKYQIEWLNKMTEIHGLTRNELLDGKAKNTFLVSYYKNFSNFGSFNADFIVANKEEFDLSLSDFSPIYESGSWVVLIN